MGPYNPSLTFQIISVILGLLNICAGCSIILTILQFKKLRSRPNFFVLSIIASAILFDLAIAVFSHIYNSRYSMDNRDVTLNDNCNFIRIFNFLILLMCSFANILACDWYLTTFKPQFVSKFDRIYKYIIAAILVMNSIGYGMSFARTCEGYPYMLYVAYFMSVLQTVVFNLTAWLKEYPKGERAYSLLTASVTIYFCLPYFISDIYLSHVHAARKDYFTRWYVHVVHLLAQWPVYYIPVAVGFVLLKRDPLFRTAFNKVVKRRKLTREEEDELEGCEKVEPVVCHLA